MVVNEPRVALVRLPLKFRLLEVLRVHLITPRMVRVTLGGDDLEGFRSLAADDHVKLLFPEPDEHKPVLPDIGPNGMTFPEGRPRPITRDYTPRHYDAEAGELDIDFVIHGDAPASNWAAGAKPGMFLGMGGPRGSYVISRNFDWYLLAGDETVLPSIGRELEELPAGSRALAFVEVADAGEEQRIESQADVDIVWLHRKGAAPGTTGLLEQAIRNATFPEGEGFAWVAGEANTVRPIRRHLLGERGLNRQWTRFSGHWKLGVTNHDHHEPIED